MADKNFHNQFFLPLDFEIFSEYIEYNFYVVSHTLFLHLNGTFTLWRYILLGFILLFCLNLSTTSLLFRVFNARLSESRNPAAVIICSNEFIYLLNTTRRKGKEKFPQIFYASFLSSSHNIILRRR